MLRQPVAMAPEGAIQYQAPPDLSQPVAILPDEGSSQYQVPPRLRQPVAIAPEGRK